MQEPNMKKPAILHMNVKPEIKAMAVEQARRQHRSLTNYVELLILADSPPDETGERERRPSVY